MNERRVYLTVSHSDRLVDIVHQTMDKNSVY